MLKLFKTFLNNLKSFWAILLGNTFVEINMCCYVFCSSEQDKDKIPVLSDGLCQVEEKGAQGQGQVRQ